VTFAPENTQPFISEDDSMAKNQAEKTKDRPAKQAGTPTQPGAVPDLKPGKYSDGHPLDEVQYLECKLILKPDRFTSAKVFQECGELVGRAANQFGIGFSTKGVVLKPRSERCCSWIPRGTGCITTR
jgi:hypothetical protein